MLSLIGIIDDKKLGLKIVLTHFKYESLHTYLCEHEGVFCFFLSLAQNHLIQTVVPDFFTASF